MRLQRPQLGRQVFPREKALHQVDLRMGEPGAVHRSRGAGGMRAPGRQHFRHAPHRRAGLECPVAIIVHLAHLAHAPETFEINRRHDPFGGIERALGKHAGVGDALLGRDVDARRAGIEVDGRGPWRFPGGGR